MLAQLEQFNLFKSKNASGEWSGTQQQRRSYEVRAANWALDDGCGSRLPVVQAEKADSISLEPAGKHLLIAQACIPDGAAERIPMQFVRKTFAKSFMQVPTAPLLQLASHLKEVVHPDKHVHVQTPYVFVVVRPECI